MVVNLMCQLDWSWGAQRVPVRVFPNAISILTGELSRLLSTAWVGIIQSSEGSAEQKVEEGTICIIFFCLTIELGHLIFFCLQTELHPWLSWDSSLQLVDHGTSQPP